MRDRILKYLRINKAYRDMLDLIDTVNRCLSNQKSEISKLQSETETLKFQVKQIKKDLFIRDHPYKYKVMDKVNFFHSCYGKNFDGIIAQRCIDNDYEKYYHIVFELDSANHVPEKHINKLTKASR